MCLQEQGLCDCPCFECARHTIDNDIRHQSCGGQTGGGGSNIHQGCFRSPCIDKVLKTNLKLKKKTCYTVSPKVHSDTMLHLLSIFSVKSEAENVCVLLCLGHAAVLCVISLSPGWLTRPVGFGCRTPSVQLAQSRTVEDTLAPVGIHPQRHPLHLAYPWQSAGTSMC